MDELYLIYHIRKAAQLLAAFTGEALFVDIATELDGYASLVWKARRG